MSNIIDDIRNEKHVSIEEITITRDDARAYMDGDLEMNDIKSFDEKFDKTQNAADQPGACAYLVIRVVG